jgi:hypothetical protein
MGNIIGEGFNETIHNQVYKRQAIFGAINKSGYQKYLNGRTPFIKLTSAIDIDNTIVEKLKKYGVNALTGNGLAKDYVLFGGVSLGDNIRKGFDQTYGIGTSQGYRPMPGITSFDTKNRNRGSIRETNIQIKAYNTEQFAIIDALYLRLGYTVLIEWGHSVYLTNDGLVKDIIQSDTLSSNFLGGTYKNQQELFTAINNNKIKLQGNYDATYGKITNFSWNFEQDGTYNISLKILSVGDVIESLRVNTIASGKETKLSTEELKEAEEDLQSADTEEEILDYSKHKDSISKLFFDAKELLNKGTTNGQISTISDSDAVSLGFKLGADFAMFVETTRRNEERYYVRLGGFLQYLQDNRLFYDKAGAPCINIDYDENTNLIFTTPYVLSADPRICIVKATIDMEGIENPPLTVFTDLPKDFKEEIKGTLIGKLMNVYMNMSWIVKSMDSIKDPDNKDAVSLYDLLKKISEGINSSLGNLNKIEPVVDEEENRIYFLDETPLPDKTTIIQTVNPNARVELTRFEVFGYKDDYSNFITELGIKTEITNNLANMITIGAQANGQAVGEDATAFSKWNVGLIDRVSPVKKSKDTNPQSPQEKAEEQKSIEEQNADTIKQYSDFVTKMNELNFDDSIEEFSSILTNLLNLFQSQKSITDQTATGIMIPINLNLTMVGLSGMKIYQKFSINQNFLPINYDETLEFLIKGVSHKIDNKGWFTTIEALSIPKSTSSGANPELSYTKPPLNTTETSSGGGTSNGVTALTAGAAEINKAGSVLSGITPGKCSAKVGPISNIPGIDRPEDQKRKTALQKGYDATFANGEFKKGGRCARYTYDHAFNYVQALNGKPTTIGASIPANGNANQSTYWANLIKQGYVQHVAGKNITKPELQSLLNGGIQFNLGDVVVYWANDKPNDGGASQYGHTQMYVGKNQIKEKVNSPSEWITDSFTNYGVTFVYRKYKYNCWNILVFRAPLDLIPGQNTDLATSRETYINIAKQIVSILNKTDKYDNGKPLLEAVSGAGNDNEQAAVGRIRQILGLQGTTSKWFNLLSLSSLNPGHKKLFEEQLLILQSEILKSNNSYDFKVPAVGNKDAYGAVYITMKPDF